MEESPKKSKWNHSPEKWKWYHYVVSIFAWIFLLLVHFVWVIGPWYLVFSEYFELRNGIDIIAYYETSSEVYTDTKLDYEKEYRYYYRFSHPTTGERMEYYTLGVGKDNHREEIHLKFNPDTGSAGFGDLISILFSKIKYLIASVFGLIWVGFLLYSRISKRASGQKKHLPKKQKGSSEEHP